MGKVIGYIRASSDKGNETLLRQFETILGYASVSGIEIDDILEDRGKSGYAAERASLQSLLAAVKSGEVQSIVVTSLDRLCRNAALGQQILTMCFSNGVQVLSLTEDIQIDNRENLSEVMAILKESEQYRQQISQKMKTWHEFRRKLGLKKTGPAPYGYFSSEGKLIPDSSERLTLKFIDYLRNSCGLTYREIAGRLNSEGAKTRMGKLWNAKSVATVVTKHLPKSS